MPRYKKRHKRGIWKGIGCWVVVLHLVAFTISSPSYTNTKPIFSKFPNSLIVEFVLKPNYFNCLKIIQMCSTWNFFPPFKISPFFFLAIFIDYPLGITRHKWMKKMGWKVFRKWNTYSCGYFNFLEMLCLFGDGWKITLNKVPCKYIAIFFINA